MRPNFPKGLPMLSKSFCPLGMSLPHGYKCPYLIIFLNIDGVGFTPRVFGALICFTFDHRKRSVFLACPHEHRHVVS